METVLTTVQIVLVLHLAINAPLVLNPMVAVLQGPVRPSVPHKLAALKPTTPTMELVWVTLNAQRQATGTISPIMILSPAVMLFQTVWSAPKPQHRHAWPAEPATSSTAPQIDASHVRPPSMVALHALLQQTV